MQVGVLQHETSFTYAQTQQVEREKQVIELTTDGLYDIQTLNVVVNTSQVDSDFIPEFLVTWGERTSEPVSVLDLMENTGVCMCVHVCVSLYSIPSHSHRSTEGDNIRPIQRCVSVWSDVWRLTLRQ